MAETGSPGVDGLGAAGERLAVKAAELAALSAPADSLHEYNKKISAC